MEKTRLAQECAKLDPAFEQALADEGLAAEVDEWPEYEAGGLAGATPEEVSQVVEGLNEIISD